MDVLFATSTWPGPAADRGQPATSAARPGAGHPMDAIISSMRSHLLDGRAGQAAPSPDPTPGPILPVTQHRARRSLVGFLTDGVDPPSASDLPGTSTLEAENRQMFGRRTGDTASRQGSHQPSDGQFTSSDLPLSRRFLQPPLEEVNVDITPEHPRLQSDFYQRLRSKYPKAFRRKTSTASDTTSVCSDIAGSENPIAMTPMPRPSHSHPENIPQSSSHRERGVSPSSSTSGQRRWGSSGGLRENSSSTYVTTQDVISYLCEDLSIHGSSSSVRTARQQLETDMSKTWPAKANGETEPLGHIQGILKKDILLRSDLTTDLKHQIGSHTDTVVSLKDRLRQNKLSLKSLLSEENNPLRKRRQRQPEDLNRSFESDIFDTSVQQLEHRTVEKYRTESSSQFNHNLSPSQPLDVQLHNDIPTSFTAQHDAQSLPRSLADQPKRKHLGTKRYISPDSAHDSAVDMDTASLQSSPGSSDTQANGHNITSWTKEGLRNTTSQVTTDNTGGFVSHGGDGHVTSVLTDYKGALSRHTGRVGSQEFLFAVGSSSQSKDSDVDSGIAQACQPRVSRERNDSLSSLENEQDLEINTFPRVHNGQRFTSLSTQDLRAAHKTRPGGTREAKYGPLKADHSIQPASPRQQCESRFHPEAEELTNLQRSVSAFDLSHKRASPINRVRFEDEVCETEGLQNHHQVSARPDLWDSGHGGSPGETSTSGTRRRAHKLKGGRTPNGTAASGSLSQSDAGIRVPSSRSDVDSRMRGLPPSGRNGTIIRDEGPKRAHKLRSRSRTPTEMVQAVASDSHTVVNSNMEVHRASPVVVLPPPVTPVRDSRLDDSQLYLSDTPSSDMDLHDEVAYFSGFSEAWNTALDAKKSKKPWKRNKGQYTPSNEVERLQVNMARRQGMPGRPQSTHGDTTGGSKPPTGRRKVSAGGVQRPSSCTAEIITPSGSNDKTSMEDRHQYEEVQIEGAGVKHLVENPYEEVDFRQDNRPKSPEHAGMYAVPVRKSRRDGMKTNPCIIDQHDDTIYHEEAPPVPERGYASDLEKYKDLSGSRSSLSEKMGSFRKAAKNKWSALRRAVSLERISHPDSDSSTGKMMKSPSLQSLAKKLSFSKKDKQRSSDFGDIPPRPPSHSQPKRPSSAPLGRSSKHSSSLTSLSTVDGPQNFRAIGKLKQLNVDGTQIIELVRPPHGPFGFYIARGSIKYGGGVFVSRLSDALPEHFFAGLLGIGDEIQEINCQPIKNLTLDEVYALMAERHHLLLKTLPYLARKDT